MRFTIRTIMFLAAVLLAVPPSAQAQATAPDTAAVTGDVGTVYRVLGETPLTVDSLVTLTGRPEATVRAAVNQLLQRRLVRYRLVPLANGDTTATGRPRRQRAYYRPDAGGAR